MRTKCRMPSKYIWELNFFHTKITNFNCKTQADGYMCIVVQAAGSINPSAKCISLHSFIKFASLAYLKLTSTFGNCLVWVKSQLEEIRSLDNYISHHRAWSVLLSQFQTKHWTMNLRRGLLSKFPKVFVSLDFFNRFKCPFVWMYCKEQVIKLMRVKKWEYDSIATVVK